MNMKCLNLGLCILINTPMDALYAGQVGYLITGMKTVQEARVGDTIYHTKKPVTHFLDLNRQNRWSLPVFIPVDATEFELLRDAIEKLTLNDASVTVEKKTSAALGLGFRCGFLGLLHMDVFKQRLEQEYNITVIATAPSVLYKIKLKHTGEMIDIETPSDFPEANSIEEIYEPMINATIIVPKQYLGNIITLCEEKRGIQKDMKYLG